MTFRRAHEMFVAVGNARLSIERGCSLQHCERLAPAMMMIAHDSSPEPGALAPATIEGLRSALAGYVSEPDGDAADLRATLRILSVEAREKSIQAEQLLVVLKDVWYSLPSVQQIAQPADQARLLQRIVTICIKEYYITQSSS